MLTDDGELRIVDYGHWNLSTAVDTLNLILGSDPDILEILDER